MTLEDLDHLLPNGLHDAQITAVAHDYSSSVVTFAVDILTDLPDMPESDSPYQSATIRFQNTLFCSVERPENERIIGVPGSIWFQYQRLDLDRIPPKTAQALPEGALCYSLYVLEWESCITLAAMDVTFSWGGPDFKSHSDSSAEE